MVDYLYADDVYDIFHEIAKTFAEYYVEKPENEGFYNDALKLVNTAPNRFAPLGPLM